MKYLRSLTAIACLLLTFPVNPDQSFQTFVQKLHCATNAQTAAAYIKDIRNTALHPPGLPVTHSGPGSSFVTAASLDQTLSILYESSLKYPENHELIEQTIIQWNFCPVIDSGIFFDHTVIDKEVIRIPSAGSATNWQGFKSFGLLPQTSEKSLFKYTTHYKASVINTLADQNFLQTYIKHCLPHPDNGKLYRSNKKNFISRIQNRPTLPDAAIKTDWITECTAAPDKAIPTSPKVIEAPSPSITKDFNVKPDLPPLAAAQPVTQAETNSSVPAPTVIAEPETLAEDDPEVAESTPASVVVAVPKNSPAITDEGAAVPFEQSDTSTTTEILPAAVVITGPSNGNTVATTNINNSKGISGSVSLENRSFELSNTSLKLAVAYKPLQDSYWFVRSALNVSQQSKPLTYSWGIGYDDWHPGTWALQLNHWGPLAFGDGLDLDNAVAEISYKLKSNWLKDKNLSGSVALSKPLTDKPVLSLGWSWNPYSHWFVRSTVIKPLDSSDINWSYGFGFTRYNKSSWSVEYNNWGVNDLPELNFVDNGQLSVIYRWAY